MFPKVNVDVQKKKFERGMETTKFPPNVLIHKSTLSFNLAPSSEGEINNNYATSSSKDPFAALSVGNI